MLGAATARGHDVLNNLSAQQFPSSRTSANANETSTNGQSASQSTNTKQPGTQTTTTVQIRGSSPSISTRST